MVTSLTPGTTYEFKIEAKNEYGYSDYSSTLSLLCAYISATPTSVVTSIDGSTVKIAWSLTTTNGTPITSYKVHILEIGTATYTLESSDCDGTDSTIISNRYCNINFSTLIAAPYNYNGGESVYAKVIAVNTYGETVLSTEGNGAVYTRVPDAPLSLTEDNSVRSSTDNGLTWSPGAHDGGYAVINYRIK